MRGLAMRCSGALLGAAALLHGGHAALAQEALYGPQPPKGSAYVRIVNALGQDVDVKPEFREALHLGNAGADRASAYEVVENVVGRALKLSLSVGGKTVLGSVQADPDGFLTVLLVPDEAVGAKVVGVADLATFNQNRARLSFYNAVPGCGSGTLALEPGGQVVFKDVDSLGSKARAVNPVTTQVKASCADHAAEPLALSGLEAGGMVSVFLLVDGGKPSAFVTRDIATPYHH
jgi:hypothetical protein